MKKEKNTDRFCERSLNNLYSLLIEKKERIRISKFESFELKGEENE